jgi:hypothetical protein
MITDKVYSTLFVGFFPVEKVLLVYNAKGGGKVTFVENLFFLC